jgi:hypothetical protein
LTTWNTTDTTWNTTSSNNGTNGSWNGTDINGTDNSNRTYLPPAMLHIRVGGATFVSAPSQYTPLDG